MMTSALIDWRSDDAREMTAPDLNPPLMQWRKMPPKLENKNKPETTKRTSLFGTIGSAAGQVGSMVGDLASLSLNSLVNATAQTKAKAKRKAKAQAAAEAKAQAAAKAEAKAKAAAEAKEDAESKAETETESETEADAELNASERGQQNFAKMFKEAQDAKINEAAKNSESSRINTLVNAVRNGLSGLLYGNTDGEGVEAAEQAAEEQAKREAEAAEAAQAEQESQAAQADVDKKLADIGARVLKTLGGEDTDTGVQPPIDVKQLRDQFLNVKKKGLCAITDAKAFGDNIKIRYLVTKNKPSYLRKQKNKFELVVDANETYCAYFVETKDEEGKPKIQWALIELSEIDAEQKTDDEDQIYFSIKASKKLNYNTIQDYLNDNFTEENCIGLTNKLPEKSGKYV